MSIDKYQIFLKTVELGSFTAAARALNFTQSGVSHAMGALEQELGVTLLVRSHGGVVQRLSETDGGPAFFRMGVNPQEKLKLDKAAAKLLRDNCMVFWTNLPRRCTSSTK